MMPAEPLCLAGLSMAAAAGGETAARDISNLDGSIAGDYGQYGSALYHVFFNKPYPYLTMNEKRLRRYL